MRHLSEKAKGRYRKEEGGRETRRMCVREGEVMRKQESEREERESERERGRERERRDKGLLVVSLGR